MKYVLFIPILGLLMLFSCADPDLSQKLEEAQARLNEAKTSLDAMQVKLDSIDIAGKEKKLVHLVFLKLKDNLRPTDSTMLFKIVSLLENIDGVHDFQVGEFADLGDQRVLSDYGIILSMSFKTKAYYNYYQGVEVHERVREQLKRFLAAPPTTYDYWTD